MTYRNQYRLVLGEGLEKVKLDPRSARRVRRVALAKPTISPQRVARALRAKPGSKELINKIPAFAMWRHWLPVATFSVCQKTGTALWLDMFDVDHFDGFTDMQRNLAECRAWFSSDEFAYWGSAKTKTGRINCYFNAPSAGNYVCHVQLQSYGGPAQVECLIDSSSFGPLPFNGSIDQPHPCVLSAGGHHFRIRQISGSFFFVGLSVWQV